MSQKDDRDLDAPTPPGSPMRRDEPDVSPQQQPDDDHETTDE